MKIFLDQDPDFEFEYSSGSSNRTISTCNYLITQTLLIWFKNMTTSLHQDSTFSLHHFDHFVTSFLSKYTLFQAVNKFLSNDLMLCAAFQQLLPISAGHFAYCFDTMAILRVCCALLKILLHSLCFSSSLLSFSPPAFHLFFNSLVPLLSFLPFFFSLSPFSRLANQNRHVYC